MASDESQTFDDAMFMAKMMLDMYEECPDPFYKEVCKIAAALLRADVKPSFDTTDLERWHAFLGDYGISRQEERRTDGGTTLTLSVGEQGHGEPPRRVLGYAGPITAVEFDAQGKFLPPRAYEAAKLLP